MKGILLHSETNDIVLRNGTMAIGTTDDQNAQLIVLAEKGEFKEYPQLGVGISQFLKSSGRDNELLRTIRVQLALDGIRPKQLTYQNKQLHIEI